MAEKETLEKLTSLENRLNELEQKVSGLSPIAKKKKYYQDYKEENADIDSSCLLYTSPSPRDRG